MLPRAILVLLLTSLAGAQDEAQQKADAFRRFRAVSTLRQLAIVRDIEREVVAQQDPFVLRITGAIRGASTYPEAGPGRWFEPSEWNEPGAPSRTLLKATDPSHAKQRAQMPELVFLPDLRKGVLYDWGSGKIVRRKKPLTLDERCANLLHGYPPGSDERIAQILQALDQDPRLLKLGKYFEHWYADLNARVYEGITLYEAWASGAALEMPDMDVIAFNSWVRNDDSLHSPIAGPDSAPVFEEMGKAALEYRKHRTLREAAAAAFVRAEPMLDPRYAPLVPRCHFLWARLGDEVATLHELFTLQPDRDAIVEQVDAEVTRSEESARRRDQWAKARIEMQRQITKLAIEAIARGT